MKYLVSLPENTLSHFHSLASVSPEEWFCGSDPQGCKVGSGGGTAWLLYKAWRESGSELVFREWLKQNKRIIVHGGGQSRRLPSYAAMGKLLLPLPVFSWERGQRLNQTLLDLQKPLLDKILHASPESSHTLIASGDALITSPISLQDLPDADVICFGLSVDPSLASRHGVFVTSRKNPEKLDFMLQKPSTDTLRSLAKDYLFLIDVGIWLLSDRAVDLLMKKCGWDFQSDCFSNKVPDSYDLYGTFGLALGETPDVMDEEIASLSVSVQQVPEGAFYHFGTSPEIISSSLALQNIITDQKDIWTRNVKPHPAIFIQNSRVDIPIQEFHANLWIENSHISTDWNLNGNQLITGIPENSWAINLPPGICLDMAPVGNKGFVIRPYGMKDAFRGRLDSEETLWLNQNICEWFARRDLTLAECGLKGEEDLQNANIFPLLKNSEEMEQVIRWMINPSYSEGRQLWLQAERFSASRISEETNLVKLEEQRKHYRSYNWKQLASNNERSVFFQVDLDHAAKEFAESHISIPEELEHIDDPLSITHKGMFLSRVNRYSGRDEASGKTEAFRALQESLLESLITRTVEPVKNVYDDQIVWSRSPVRIDLAGGWTDTPPYSVLSGGNVVNISLELNGQPPLQAFIRPSEDRKILLRSIDLGEREEIRSYQELLDFTGVGSPFAIPKAALCLAGFHPRFCSSQYCSLIEQLDGIGCGLEISFLAAIPKGSGMGTSSILASTILGALSDFCSLGWDQFEICNRTLALEQLLTTGGGWQDQYGGIIPGVKLLQTEKGWNQTPKIRWLPDRLFTEPEYSSSMLLYYTGITRVAKKLLAEIVEGMFLNERDRLAVLKEMKQHAMDTWETIQLGDFSTYGKKIARSWELNKRLDADITNPQIEAIISVIDDLSLGYKLPGAGGGGYLYIVAKDPEAARKIRKRLDENPPNPRARFVDLAISQKGLQVSRS